MAGICCGVVADTEPALSVEPSSRASRRKRLELRPCNLVTDVAVLRPLENDRKRKRIEVFPTLPGRSRIVDDEKLAEKNEVAEDLVDVRPKFGMTSICGRRRDMEDAVSIHPSFCKLDHTHFYGVFDGHGCSHVANKCKDRLHDIFKEEIESSEDGEESVVQWKEMMERSFEKMDKEVQEWTVSAKISICRCELQTPRCDVVGSTAVVAVVTPEKIVVSNCGDSRAVLCRNGFAIPLSIDHKPDRPDELRRIEAAGGRVIYWDGPRVLGVLAMSRAIGDNYLKPYVISEPEVTVSERTAEDECLILASDGLWDVVSNETACSVVQTCFRAQKAAAVAAVAAASPPVSPGSDVAVKGQSCDKACMDASILLTKLALARHSSDNISVVVVDLRRNPNQRQKL